jgi:hypothetical protein
MGRGDNRRTPKMRRRRAQTKLKARRLRKLLAARVNRPAEPQRGNPRVSVPQSIAQDTSGTSGTGVGPVVPRFVTATDLIAAVAATTDETQPIAWSPDVRREFARLGVLTGERTQDPDASRNGRQFEAADHAASRDGQLQKWKSNNTIGWSFSAVRDPTAYARALEIAVASGHRRLDYADRRWQSLRYDAASGAWISD